VWEAVDRFDPGASAGRGRREDAPRFQLAPVGARGYIEGRPVPGLYGRLEG
jgi:hypothetical protein